MFLFKSTANRLGYFEASNLVKLHLRACKHIKFEYWLGATLENALTPSQRMVAIPLGTAGKVRNHSQFVTLIYLSESSWLQSNESNGKPWQLKDLSFVQFERSRLVMRLPEHDSTSKFLGASERSSAVSLPSSHMSALRLGISAKSGNLTPSEHLL